jgi:hypothetical protein
MWTRTSKEFIEMKKQTTKEIFDLCASAYVETSTHQKISYPKWIEEITNDREDAERGFVAIQAWLLAENMHVKVKDTDSNLQPIEEAWVSLKNNMKYFDTESLNQVKSITKAVNWKYALVAEAALRDPTVVTPADIVQLMQGLTNSAKDIDVYALDGLGLRFGASRESKVKFVGDEFGVGNNKAYPKSISKINDEIKTWYRHQAFVNKQFIDLDWYDQSLSYKGEALLVNGCRSVVPFGQADASLDQPEGELNKCLEAGYQTVVALVSNHALTAGRGVAEKIFRYCLDMGLRKIVQLPMGVLGYKSQQHSILVFNNGANKETVQFVNLALEENIRVAKKGFAELRRANALRPSGDGYWGSPYVEKAATVEVQQILKQKKFISFEVGQFLSLQEDCFKELRNRFEFSKLSEFMEIFRSHHMEEFEDSIDVDYYEVGAGSINESGWIVDAIKRQTTATAIDKRNAQFLRDGDLIMCFRGSPDSFGKVGIFRKKGRDQSMPNQSFVILRMKQTVMNEFITPEFILMWLRSTFAKIYLKSRSISPDVMRVSPKAIGEIEVPSGPQSELALESEQISQIYKSLNEIELLRQQIASIEDQIWQVYE